MPGLRLTPNQAARLLGLDNGSCRRVINALVGSAFLRWTPDGESRSDRILAACGAGADPFPLRSLHFVGKALTSYGFWHLPRVTGRLSPPQRKPSLPPDIVGSLAPATCLSTAPSPDRAPDPVGLIATIREALRGSRIDYDRPGGRAVIMLAVPMVMEMAMESIRRRRRVLGGASRRRCGRHRQAHRVDAGDDLPGGGDGTLDRRDRAGGPEPEQDPEGAPRGRPDNQCCWVSRWR
jgi:hypothetical protein